MTHSAPSPIADAAYRAFERVNELTAAGDVPPPSDEVVLVGDGAAFDSMAFVNFVVLLEEELERRLGRAVSVTNVLTTGESDGSPLTLGQVAHLLAERLE